MKKFFLISFLIFTLFLVGSISALFFYPERTQNFITESLNLKTIINESAKNYISKKINDGNINVDIEKINFLKPNRSNTVKIALYDVNIHSLKQKRKSTIKLIELGFSYKKLLKYFLLNENDLQPSYIKFQDLTLNARIEKDRILPGPLVKILSLINKNNLKIQPSLKMILENKIVIGKTNLVLVNNRDLGKEEILEIRCKNVIISKRIHRSRYLDMDCKKGKDNLFSLRANLNKNFNNFIGKFKNINSNLLPGYLLNKNFNFLKTGLNSQLNGSFNIKTNKNFVIQSINFVSEESILNFKSIEDKKNLKLSISGVFSWEKKKNLLKFYDMNFDKKIVVSGEINLTSQQGYSNLIIPKISVQDTKNFLRNFLDYFQLPLRSNLINISNYFIGGNLNYLKINIKFSLHKEFEIEEIIGSSNFSNIRFDYNNKVLKKLLSTISGNLDFILKPNKRNYSMFNVNLYGDDGIVLISNDIQYKFSNAIVSGQFYNNDFLITKADFFNNSDLEYSLHNIRVSKNELDIEKAKAIKEKKVQYIISNTTIKNMNVTKSTLKIKNNAEVSNFIKNKFNIELIGNTDLNFFLSGNLKDLNFNLKLHSNLKNSHFKINYLDLIKKKNIKSSFETEISLIDGKIAFLKNINLSIDSKTYKIDFVEFSNKNTNKFVFKNVKTPKINMDKIIISKNAGNLNIKASGKNIDLSNINKNLKSKTHSNKDVIFDLTADLIKLNPKISLTGNLQGEIKGNTFKSIAYGKILLGGTSLLDNGKFEIHSDTEISRLEGSGLVGGAETKIILQKIFNNFPTLTFDTSNGGKLLNALGFSNNIKSGDMKINIKFLNNEYDHYEGQINSKNFSIINAPGVINSLSILSFSGIGSIISGEGVFFEKGEVNISVKNKNFNFDKLNLISESLGITARGNLNLEKNLIKMIGSVAPIKSISKILSVVPAVGELLTGLKKEGLFAGQFEMKGKIENPEIKLNTMSFAPGILRELFSKDWLNNNNFFINRSLE